MSFFEGTEYSSTTTALRALVILYRISKALSPVVVLYSAHIGMVVIEMNWIVYYTGTRHVVYRGCVTAQHGSGRGLYLLC